MTSTTRRAVLIVGSLVAALIVITLAVPAVGRIVQSTERGTHELPADLRTLVLHGEVGEVSVRAAEPGEEPRAEVTVRSTLRDPEVTSTVGDGRAELVSRCQDWWWLDNCSVDWEIVVPAETELTISNSVGDIVVRDVTGALSLSGDVGDLNILGVGSPTVSARSSVGDITLSLVAAPDEVAVTSSTGDVSVTVPDDGSGYHIETNTSIGSVTNQVGSDPAQSRLIDLETSVGDITVRHGP